MSINIKYKAIKLLQGNIEDHLCDKEFTDDMLEQKYQITSHTR